MKTKKVSVWTTDKGSIDVSVSLHEFKDGVMVARKECSPYRHRWWWLYYPDDSRPSGCRMTGRFGTRRECVGWYENGGR